MRECFPRKYLIDLIVPIIALLWIATVPQLLLNRLFRHRWKKTSKLHVIGLWAGNSPVPGEFPAQRTNNAENVPFDDVIISVVNGSTISRSPFIALTAGNLPAVGVVQRTLSGLLKTMGISNPQYNYTWSNTYLYISQSIYVPAKHTDYRRPPLTIPQPPG